MEYNSIHPDSKNGLALKRLERPIETGDLNRF